MASLIRSANLWGFREEVTKLGGDADAMLRRFHLDPVRLADPDAYVVYRNMLRLLEAAATELDCPDLGQRLSAWQGLNMLGPVAVVSRNAKTVLDGLISTARYLHIHGPALKLSLLGQAPNGNFRFRYHINEPGLTHLAQAYELSLANGVRIVRLLGGDGAQIQGIRFTHAQLSETARYRQVYGCPIAFEQEQCSFEISAATAGKAVTAADSKTFEIAERYLESTYASGSDPISQQVRELIRRLLPTGHCAAEIIADKLALHPRSLHRHLASEGVRYRELLDAERRERAMHYLSETQLYLSQVSGLLGYTEQSSLNRACQRWFRLTPRAFRQQTQHS